MNSRTELVKQFYESFSKVEKNEFVDNILVPEFAFSAPPDPLLNRDEFFEKCWPNGANLKNIKYTRLFEHGNEVILTHEYLKPDGKVGCNTDIFTFYGNQIIRLEVFFGWDVTE